jgi:dihydrofolate reductase
MPYCEKLYITYVNKEFQGDTYFPLEKLTDFVEIHRETALDEHSGIELDFTIYQKKEEK